jgi:hypothetical protein
MYLLRGRMTRTELKRALKDHAEVIGEASRTAPQPAPIMNGVSAGVLANAPGF